MRFVAIIVLSLSCVYPALLLAEVATPSIVEICASNGPGAPQVIERHSLGFIVEEEGFLLTSYESLTKPETGTLLSRFEVSWDSGTGTSRYAARIIGVEPTLNFAVLKIEREGGFAASKILRDDSLVAGEEIFAATQANAVSTHLVVGRLEALNSKECYQQDLTATMLAAEIDIPSSGIGGPVFDRTGSVIGMFTGYHPPEDDDDQANEAELTHILPIFLAFNIYDSIKQRQSLASPWTGFSVRPLNEVERRQFPVAQGQFTGGIAFEYIWESSPAAAMGLAVDDILLRFAYYPIHSPADFQKWLYLYGVGRTVKLYILRDGEILVKEYTIEERPSWVKPL
ncbi:S1C family serine protease [Coraliomargarita algicola]|uniref:S1C family serine protease n=1 Tax=Coraliomargarita algicola TaxID=3092156 RepID=A0ABZ0RRC3_9BACT|nr:S1C family serine protease [Coraliomargarita sp. J2-16]WPJ97908.1 S1C family serine protease [Coraliomargarita sp. J2-16]